MISYDELMVFLALFALQLVLVFRLEGAKRGITRLWQDPLMATGVIGFFYVLVHYLVFPDPLARFFIAQYVMSVIVFLSLLSEITS